MNGVILNDLKAAILVFALAVLALPASSQHPDRDSIIPAGDFRGTIDRSAANSRSHWPPRAKPPESAPNVLIWMIDDAGFGHLGPYGGLIDTPTIDALAKRGLVYNNFHTTALCSPTRASLLSGRNHHAISVGSHAQSPSGFPGYWGRVPPSAATIAKVLQQTGYATFALGKWDHMPNEDTSPAGPFTYWPSGQGFDRFYGFLAAETDNFHPPMWSDHTPVDPSVGRPDYHLTTDMADRAIEWLTTLKSSAPGKPFFMYWATGAVHGPHHAPADAIRKYRGKFDLGWDQARESILERQKMLGIVPEKTELPERQDLIAAWNELDETGKRVSARAMEAFAGQLDHADQQFGRIVEALSRIGELDNTIILVLSDNGASAEGGLEGTFNEFRSLVNQVPTTFEDNIRYLDEWGGPGTHPHFPVGWAMAGNTPLKYYKQSAHEGGIRGPLVVSWPKGIRSRGEVRTQFHHVNDIMATLLDAVGVALPEAVDGVRQQPLDGVSMRYSFDDAGSPTQKRVQYFELWGNRGIWADGWKAVVLHNPEPWNLFNFVNLKIDDSHWELYQVSRDFNELQNLAMSEPAKLKEMQALFDAEARRNNVYPLAPDMVAEHRRRFERIIAETGGKFVFYGDQARRLPESLAPPVAGRSFTIDATVKPRSGSDTGVIVAVGGAMGGYALYLNNGKPVFCYNSYAEFIDCVRGNVALPAQRWAHLRFAFEHRKPTGGTGTLMVDDSTVGQGQIRRTNLRMFSVSETFDIGADDSSAVSTEYQSATPFPGEIRQVVFQVDIKG